MEGASKTSGPESMSRILANPIPVKFEVIREGGNGPASPLLALVQESRDFFPLASVGYRETRCGTRISALHSLYRRLTYRCKGIEMT